MIVTEQILQAGMSDRGAWSLKQLKCLLPAKEFMGNKGAFPDHGWRKRIIGRNVSKKQIERFLELKNAHLKEKTGQLFTKPRDVDGEKRKEFKDWPGKIDYHDYLHMQSIKQEIKDG